MAISTSARQKSSATRHPSPPRSRKASPDVRSAAGVAVDIRIAAERIVVRRLDSRCAAIDVTLIAIDVTRIVVVAVTLIAIDVTAIVVAVTLRLVAARGGQSSLPNAPVTMERRRPRCFDALGCTSQ
jgi:hypothetical protein